MMDCNLVEPVSAFYSTNLNNKMESYGRLGQRICRAIGAPLINIEIHEDQLNEFIGISCEMFTKFAGYTQEYLVFDSDLYDLKRGIRLDVLFSMSRDFNFTYDETNTPQSIRERYSIGSMVIGEANNPLIFQVLDSTKPNQYQLLNSYDYLIGDYRRVMDVIDFEEGSSTGVNTLFTIEQTLAQQTYFSYAMGNYGFDLISWTVLKNWLDTREKVLALRRDISFDPRTQVMHMVPPPKDSVRFFGVLGCYVERSLIDIIKEPWVYQYALALTKIAVGSVRGKYTGTSLFGGGAINYDYLLRQGEQEKENLEKMLYSSAPGMGDAAPPSFFLG